MGQELLIAVVGFVIGTLLVLVARPNRNGENPGFLKSSFMQMVYPVIAMLFLVVGIAHGIIAIN